MKTALVLALCSAWLASPAPAGDYLLVNDAEIRAALEKAGRCAWARVALDRVMAEAEEAVRVPVPVPAGVGQWPHWYSCKKDGAALRTESPTVHRCPVCGTVYRGDPYDAVVAGRTHNRLSSAVRALGLAYRFSGREEFARRAAEILTAYADRYARYPRHDINGEDNVRGGRIMAQTLDESTWLIPVTWGYALVRDRLDGPTRRHIERDLLTAAARAIREHRLGIHNIQCWKNTAVGLAGFASGDSELVREAIDDPERGFRAQVARGVTAEGLWWEGSLGYHVYTMEALWPLAEAARRAGLDLYSDQYRKLFDAPLSLALPNGDAPGFNDSAGGNIASYAPLYELAFARWGKAEYGRVLAHSRRDSLQALLWGAQNPPEGPLAPESSTLLASSGFAVLRAGSTAAAVRFGAHGGGHGHPDKLGVVTFGAGRLFGLDPGSINYGVPLHREWYRSTIAHNTVSVDGQPQAGVDGNLEKWQADATATTLAANAGAAYPGVTLRRTLTLQEGRIEDRFECASETGHTYDWAFHAPGRLTTSLKMTPRPGPLGESNGYQHIQDVAEAHAAGEWWARWENGGARLTLRFQAAPGTVVYTGLAPGRDPASRVPLIIARRRAKTTVFEATHVMEGASDASLRVSVYATAGGVNRYLATEPGRRQAIAALKRLSVSKVFLEGRRGDEYVPPELLRAARDDFRQAGLEVAGGIATVPGKTFGVRQTGPLAWLDYEAGKTRRDIAAFFRENAAVFDEIIVDDFYCTMDVSPASERARGQRPWGEYRRDLLVSLIEPMIAAPARAVRPGISLIIKFPQWYDRFHLFGYDPARMPAAFDRVWVGTEVRNPATARMGFVQPTEGYINFRWLAAVAGAKVEGAWFDHIECTARNFLDQAYQSVLAGARELTLFSLFDVMEGHPGHALLRAAMPELRELALKVRRAPLRGVAYYKPAGSDAGDNLYLMDYIAMLGIPVVPVAQYPAGAKAAILGVQAAADTALLEHMRRHVDSGATLVLTSGLLQRLGDEGARLVAAGRGRVLVWNVRTFSEQDFRDAGEYLLAPRELDLSAMRPPREALLAALGIRFSAPPGVALYLFGTAQCLYNFHSRPVRVRIDGADLNLGANALLWREGASR